MATILTTGIRISKTILTVGIIVVVGAVVPTIILYIMLLIYFIISSGVKW